MIGVYQITSILICLLILILESAIVWKKAFGITIKVVTTTYALHVLFFYFVVLNTELNQMAIDEWSSGLRLHGLLSVLLGTIYQFAISGVQNE